MLFLVAQDLFEQLAGREILDLLAVIGGFAQ